MEHWIAGPNRTPPNAHRESEYLGRIITSSDPDPEPYPRRRLMLALGIAVSMTAIGGSFIHMPALAPRDAVPRIITVHFERAAPPTLVATRQAVTPIRDPHTASATTPRKSSALPQALIPRVEHVANGIVAQAVVTTLPVRDDLATRRTEDPAGGAGESAGSTTVAGAGTTPVTSAGDLASRPCGYVTFVPVEPTRRVGTTFVERVRASVHYPDGHVESALFPYDWNYPNGEANDPWSTHNVRNGNLETPVQFPPRGTPLVALPSVLQYILSHARLDGTTDLTECTTPGH